MAVKEMEIFRILPTILFIMACTLVLYYLFSGDTIFCDDAATDSVFHVDLQKDRNYQLWVLDMNGPETVQVSVVNGSYTPYGDTFRLMHPEGDYLPYHPDFSVKDTGSYDIIVHPLNPGAIRLKIQQDSGLNLNRIIRDIRNIL